MHILFLLVLKTFLIISFLLKKKKEREREKEKEENERRSEEERKGVKELRKGGKKENLISLKVTSASSQRTAGRDRTLF